MKNRGTKSIVKYIVIGGYVLLVAIMLLGLWAIFNNLVDFSEKKVRDEDRRELVIVSNIINELYEAEGYNDLLTYDSAKDYLQSFSDAKPNVFLRIDTLKQLSIDTMRVSQLDSLQMLLNQKEENLISVISLMDSLRKVPPIIRESINTYVPKKLNSNISDYIEQNIVEDIVENANTDTTVIRRERKGLIRRLGDAIAGKQDSTVILENRPIRVVQKDFSLVVDTIVNMVRYSERLNLESQKKFQIALVSRQAAMSNTNQILTSRVDELLKHIEKEELEKAISLVEAKEDTISRSYNTVSWLSLLAVLIALVFGFLFIVDINKSQRYKRRLEESNHRISKLLKSREKLMYSISHDIKAPMNSIMGYLELMKSKSDKGSDEMYLNNMKLSGEHILQLVYNLLNFQKIESGKWSRNNMNFEVQSFARNTIDSFVPLANQKNLSFKVNNHLDKNLVVFGDPFMIREVYSNIISNAIKYTSEGYVEVTVEHDSSEGMLKLTVKDTGVGISDEDKHLVFEEFEQIKQEGSNVHFTTGNGLGMAITKGLVDEMNGDISFNSTKGVGTEFFVSIPVEISNDDKAKKNVSQNNGSSDLKLSNLSVLFVDDDSIQQTLVKEILKPHAVRVVSETNPINVFNILKNQSFDLIFLDIQMPGMNGFALIKEIKELNIANGTPIIALTATSEIDVEEYRKSGFASLLQKPFNPDELVRSIKSVVENKKPSDISQSITNVSIGIDNLIAYVKDDSESSKAILKAFISECESLNISLKSLNGNGGDNNSANLAHKMLPLFQMIGDEKLTNLLISMEKGKEIKEEELNLSTKKIDSYIKQAKELVSNFEKGD